MAEERHHFTVSPSDAERRNRSFIQIQEKMSGVHHSGRSSAAHRLTQGDVPGQPIANGPPDRAGGSGTANGEPAGLRFQSPRCERGRAAPDPA